jgi:MFS family permease
MTATQRAAVLPTKTPPRPWAIVGQTAAALAAGMGIGRFVYTPILPLMHAQAGLSAQLGAELATANYLGYLIGALAAIFIPALTRSQLVLRLSLLLLAASLALMPATHAAGAWLGLRLIAGIASALIFVIAVSALFNGLLAHAPQLVGWGFGGAGAGIALSGGLVLALRAAGSWQQAWWSAAALALVCSALGWRLPTKSQQVRAPQRADQAGRYWFAALLASYSLEGVGYIVAGTFLVAAIDQTGPAWTGSFAWVLVGLAAVPAAALWAWLGRIWSRPTLLVAALGVQAIGIALPVLASGVAAALVAAILFGATFLGISTIVLATGVHLRMPHAVAILTTGYGAGQILGPLVVAPFLRGGYHQALLIGAVVVVLAAIAAAALRRRFPHHLGPLPSRVRPTGSRPAGCDPPPTSGADRRCPAS